MINEFEEMVKKDIIKSPSDFLFQLYQKYGELTNRIIDELDKTFLLVFKIKRGRLWEHILIPEMKAFAEL